MNHPSRIRLVSSVFWLPLMLSAATTAWVAWLTYRVSAAPVPQADPSVPGSSAPPLWTADLAYPGDHSPIWAWILLALLAATALAYAGPRRRNARWGGVGAVAGLVVLTLGAAAYAPCVQGSESPISLPAWVLSLFIGAYEFDGPAKACAMRFAPGFSLARSLGIIFTVTAGASVLVRLLQERMARFRVRLSDQLDVVIGLNQASLPLVRALLAENSSTLRDPGLVISSPGFLGDIAKAVEELLEPSAKKSDSTTRPAGWRMWRLTGLRPGDTWRRKRPRRLTVILDGNESNALLGEARAMGAIVVTGDPLDRTVLRMVAVADRGTTQRVAFHRMFALSDDLGLNLEVDSLLQDILADDVLNRHDQALPRLFVRMDDERRAQKWRTSQIQMLGGGGRHAGALGDPCEAPHLIRDAVTVDGLSAIAIIEQLIPRDQFDPTEDWPTHVGLVGDSSLSLACLDELAWQLWTRAEIMYRATQTDDAVRNGAPKEFPLTEVALFGATAAARKTEWEALHGPWDRHPIALKLFEVTAAGLATDEAVSRYLDSRPRARIVIVNDTVEFDVMGSRLARLYADHQAQASRIIAVRDDLVRVSPELGAHEPIRIATGLVSRTQARDLPPTDSITRHAHQQHRAYRGSWSEESLPIPPDWPSKQTSVPWTQLPFFFREDNVRQYWQVLSWFNQNGYQWTWSRDVVDLPLRVLNDVAYAEYQRWVKTRTDLGWWPSAQGKRDDSLRLHPDLRGWEHVDSGYNVLLDEWIIRRTQATGLIPLALPNQPGSASTGVLETH